MKTFKDLVNGDKIFIVKKDKDGIPEMIPVKLSGNPDIFSGTTFNCKLCYFLPSNNIETSWISSEGIKSDCQSNDDIFYVYEKDAKETYNNILLMELKETEKNYRYYKEKREKLFKATVY